MPRRLPSDSRSAPLRLVGGMPQTPEADERWMRRAIETARPFHPHPNPRVGAVVVAPDGTMIAVDAHRAAGGTHAEAAALAACGDAEGATLYVTLEPCAHHGRTPPCTDAIIAAGVARVVVGATDPDAEAAGGAEILVGAGIEVVTGVLGDEARDLDPGYFHHRRTGRPLVTLKLATTLDGQAAAADGTSQWITTEAGRNDAHRLRARSDAVMVGAGTLRDDDPRLDVRLTPDPFPEPTAGPGPDVPDFDLPEVDGTGRLPRPVVVAGREPLPPGARLFARGPLVYTPVGIPGPRDVETVSVGGSGDEVDLTAMLDDLGGRGIVDLLVEGGPTLASGFVAAGLVDRIVWYVGPLLGGGPGRPALAGSFPTLAAGHSLTFVEVTRVGGDIRIIAELGNTSADAGRADRRGGG